MWLSRIQGESLPERVSGADLVWALAERAADVQARIALLGDSSSTAAKAKAVLESTFPGLVISGTVSPNLQQQPTKDELEEIGDVVTTTRADIVFVALGVPKQDEVIAALQSRHPAVWWIGVGGSLKFVAGSIRRAPRWMQGLGLEWLYRLQQEPSRLWKRYLLQDMPIFFSLLVNALRTRWNRKYS
jgi:N-acetylglucosaminyldiphosphoundecaprenol N-acetyl-beta-D-mannosaminyltransferase